MTPGPKRRERALKNASSSFALGAGEALLDALLAEMLSGRHKPREIDHRLPVTALPGSAARFRLSLQELRLRLHGADDDRVRLAARVGGEVRWSLPLGDYSQRLDLRFTALVRPEVRQGPDGLGLEADFANAELQGISVRLDDSIPWPASWTGDWLSALGSPLVEELSREALSFALQRLGRQRLAFGPSASRWLSELGLDAARATLEIQDGACLLHSTPPAGPSGPQPSPGTGRPAMGGFNVELQLGQSAAANLARAAVSALGRRHPKIEFSEPELRFVSCGLELSARVGLRQPGLLRRLRPRLRLDLRPEPVDGELRLHPTQVRLDLPGGFGSVVSPLRGILSRSAAWRQLRFSRSWTLALGRGVSQRLLLDLRRVRLEPDSLHLLAAVSLGAEESPVSPGDESEPPRSRVHPGA